MQIRGRNLDIARSELGSSVVCERAETHRVDLNVVEAETVAARERLNRLAPSALRSLDTCTWSVPGASSG